MGITPVNARPRPHAGQAPGDAADARLRETAQQLQGVFMQQLFQAMRETVPQDDPLGTGGLGEDIFRGMFDEHMAGTVPASLDRPGGLTDMIVRQLRARTPGAALPAGASPAPADAEERAAGDAVRDIPADTQ